MSEPPPRPLGRSHDLPPEPISRFLLALLQQILNCSQGSAEGRRFLERLSDLKVQSTLFVPDNSGLPGNQVRRTWTGSGSGSGGLTRPSLQTLSQRDIEFHLSEGGALPAQQLKNGTRLRTRVGRLSVLQVADMLEPASLVCDWPSPQASL